MITEFVEQYIAVPQDATFSYQRVSLRLDQVYCSFCPYDSGDAVYNRRAHIAGAEEFNQFHVLYRKY